MPNPNTLTGNFMNKVISIGVVCGIGWVGLGILKSQYEWVPDCAFPNPFDCVPSGKLGPARAEFGDMSVDSEDITGTVQARTFGEITMQIMVEESTFDYDDDSLFDYAGDIDATVYYNHDSDTLTEVVYNPCIIIDDGEEAPEAQAEHPYTGEAGITFNEPLEAPRTEINYVVDLDPTGTNIERVMVESGYLDACYVRIPNTPGNQDLWTNHHSNQTSFGSTQLATFRWMMDELITQYAASEACPEQLIPPAQVEEAIKELVIGDFIISHPNQEISIRNTEWDMDIQGPEVRQGQRREELANTREEFESMDRSFENENGDDFPLKHPTIGNFETYACALEASEQFQVTPDS